MTVGTSVAAVSSVVVVVVIVAHDGVTIGPRFTTAECVVIAVVAACGCE